MQRKPISEYTADDLGIMDVAERIKMAFYYEFDELIPSTMAGKIDEIVKEVLHEHEL